jgi:serine/threonine-protein kinase RsbW
MGDRFTCPPQKLELKIDSDPATLASVRKAVETLAENGGFDEKSVGEIGLVVNEAMANIIRHAYQGEPGRPIAVQAECRPDQILIRLRDWGSGVNPTSLPLREHDPLTPGGLGLVCLRQLMDEVIFAPQPDGMLLTMSRRKRVA